MSIIRLVAQELRHRKLNAWLSGLAIAAAVTLFVAYMTTAAAARRETARITRDLGFNLRILPKATDMERFWAQGFSEETMPEEAVRRLAAAKNVFSSYNHLVAALKQRFPVAGRTVLLTGLSPAITAPEQRKQPMGYQIKAGQIYLGWQVAQWLKAKPGDRLTLGGQDFRVERCLAESGTEDDVRVYGLLADVQRVLQLPGRINEIEAIDCLCLTADQDPLRALREELERALPEAKVVQLRALADGRARQRRTTDAYLAYLTAFLLAVSALSVGLLMVVNVRERKGEIGVLRALGYGSGKISALFLLKAAVLGLLGGAVGCGLGTLLALNAGSRLFQITAAGIRPDFGLCAWTLLAAPVLAALASFIPAMLAVAHDPATTLREG